MFNAECIIAIVCFVVGIGNSIYIKFMQKKGVPTMATVVNTEIKEEKLYYGMKSMGIIPILKYTAYGIEYTRRCLDIRYSETTEMKNCTYDEEVLKETGQHVGETVEILFFPHHPTIFIPKDCYRRTLVSKMCIVLGTMLIVGAIMFPSLP